LLKEIGDLNISKRANIIAEVKNTSLIEAGKIVGKSLGLINEDLTEEESQELVAKFKEVEGIDAFILPMRDLVQIPPPVVVNSGRVKDEYLYLYKKILGEDKIKEEKYSIKWDKIYLLCCARVRNEEDVEKSVLEEELLLGVKHIMKTVRPKKKIVKTLRWEIFLDVFSCNFQRHFRIKGESFKYCDFGLEVRPTSFENLILLTQSIVNLAKNTLIDKNVQSLLEGNIPITIPGPDSYDKYLVWVSQIALHKKEILK
jgi:hypothetical protein